MEKECLDCKKMMRASPYTAAEKAYADLKEHELGKDGKNICGKCFNRRMKVIK